MLAELRETVRVELRADSQRRLEALREPLWSSHPEQMRTVYVQHIEAERHVRDPLRFGYELLRKDGGCDGVEDVDRLQRNSALASQAPGRDGFLLPLRARL